MAPVTTNSIAFIRPRTFLGAVRLTGADKLAVPGKYLASARNGFLRLKELQPNTKLGDRPIFLCSNHGEAFGQLAFAYLAGKLKPGSALLHFDAHHDLMGLTRIKPFPSDPQAALAASYDDAGFIHPLFFHGLVSRYLWVLPQGVDRVNMDQYLKYFAGLPHNPFPITADLFPPTRAGFPYPVNREGSIPLPCRPKQAVVLEVVLAAELEERTRRLKEEIVLDFDLDYFGSVNSQFGDELAPEIAGFFPSDPLLGVSQSVQLLMRSRIRPAACVMAMSPEYFSRPERLSDTAAVLAQGLMNLANI